MIEGTLFEFDQHRVRREGPLVHVIFRGNLTESNTRGLLDVYQAAVDEHGLVLILMDVRESSGMDMAARKLATSWSSGRAKQIWAGVFGANAILRTTINMFNRAARVLSRDKSEPGLMFFVDEPAARVWLFERYEAAQAK
jgi:hypothetical protein